MQSDLDLPVQRFVLLDQTRGLLLVEVQFALEPGVVDAQTFRFQGEVALGQAPRRAVCRTDLRRARLTNLPRVPDGDQHSTGRLHPGRASSSP